MLTVNDLFPVTIVTLPMESFPEHTSFLYRVSTSKGFEFGSVEGEAAGFRLNFPEGERETGSRGNSRWQQT